MNRFLYMLCFRQSEPDINRNFRCNMIAGVINALEAIIMVMLVTRVTGIEDAGILTIAFAVGNLFMTVGKFGTRNFQVTDQEEEFSFYNYCKARIFSALIMIIMLLFYVLYSIELLHSDSKKIIIIILISTIYLVEVIEDVFCGLYQQKGRLDVASMVFSIRWIFSIIVYAISLIVFKSLLISVFFTTLTSIIVCIVLLLYSYKYFKADKIRQNGWIGIIKKCFPLFAGAFLMMYLTNSPKYAIESCLTNEYQACYGFISTPLFAMELMNNFLYQPHLDEMSRCWQENDLKKFIKYIKKQIKMLLMLSVIVMAGTFFLGIPILSIVFNYNLTNYKYDLFILMIGSCLLAFVGFFAVVLTIIRKQNYMMVCYVITSVFAFFIMRKVAITWKIRGCVLAFDVIICILAILLGSIVFTQCIKRRDKKYGSRVEEYYR